MSQPQRTQSAFDAVSTNKNKAWAREYIPGYKGFVPTKQALFGKTVGAINREICLVGGSPQALDYLETTRHCGVRDELPAHKEINTDVYGNQSKTSVNWISGPTHMVRRQHVPQYKGHCRGFVNKDFIHKSFPKMTAELYAREHPMSADTDVKSRFQSTQRAQYRPQNFRRFILEPELQPTKDYNDYSRFVSEHNSEKKQSLLSRTLTPNAHATRKPNHLLTPQSARDSASASTMDALAMKVAIKPQIMETKASDSKDFFNLSDGFRRVFSRDDRKDQRMVVPVVGYQGHRRGDCSQNFFGKNFREVTIQSKFLERTLRLKNNTQRSKA